MEEKNKFEITKANNPTAQDLIEQFLSRKNQNTRRAYEADLRHFADFIGSQSTVGAMDLLCQAGAKKANWLTLQYKTSMEKENLSSATRNRRLSAIKSALKLARILGMINWTLEITGEKIQRYRDTTGCGEEAYRKLLSIADARDTAILKLLHDLGLRRAELVGIDLKDFKDGKLWILGKGRNEKEALTLPVGTKAALESWIKERGNTPGALFISKSNSSPGHRLTGDGVRRILQALAKQAGIDKPVRPHGIRHTAITTALEKTNGNISAVAKFSRHLSLETVKVYDDNRQDIAGEIASLISE
jgi:integrase/recombinase XerC